MLWVLLWMMSGASALLQVQGTLACRDTEDLYALLFRICNRSTLCRELYYIDDHTTATSATSGEAQSRDFAKFQYQLSQIRLFGAAGEDATNASVVGRLFVTHLWPEDWTPYYVVAYDAAGTECATQDLAAPSQRAFVYATMNMMMVYKQYISNEHYCNDHNERLLWDATDERFHCECRAGKVCQNDQANFNTIMAMLAIFVMALFLLLTVVQTWSTMRYFEALDRLLLAQGATRTV